MSLLQSFPKTLYEKPDRTFYLNSDVVEVAKDLLGKMLVTHINGSVTAGKIVETEAYSGRNDKACHANNGKRTRRTEVMYRTGGCAYIYLCHGIWCMTNVITNEKGKADGVLIRALEPVVGIEVMTSRRSNAAKLCSGPGVLSEALGIKVSMTGTDLLGNQIWIAHGETDDFEIETSTRINVDFAGRDAQKLWRFLVKGNKYVSKKTKTRAGGAMQPFAPDQTS